MSDTTDANELRDELNRRDENLVTRVLNLRLKSDRLERELAEVKKRLVEKTEFQVKLIGRADRAERALHQRDQTTLAELDASDAVERAWQMLEACGVPRIRANGNLARGIEVLSTRLGREEHFLLAMEKDAARWRWARADKTLWRGTYDYGVATPEEADAIADAELSTGPHSKP